MTALAIPALSPTVRPSCFAPWEGDVLADGLGVVPADGPEVVLDDGPGVVLANGLVFVFADKPGVVLDNGLGATEAVIDNAAFAVACEFEVVKVDDRSSSVQYIV